MNELVPNFFEREVVYTAHQWRKPNEPNSQGVVAPHKPVALDTQVCSIVDAERMRSFLANLRNRFAVQLGRPAPEMTFRELAAQMTEQ